MTEQKTFRVTLDVVVNADRWVSDYDEYPKAERVAYDMADTIAEYAWYVDDVKTVSTGPDGESPILFRYPSGTGEWKIAGQDRTGE